MLGRAGIVPTTTAVADALRVFQQHTSLMACISDDVDAWLACSGEDGANHSFAGVFESVIHVDREGLEAAIARVQSSFDAARVSSALGVSKTFRVETTFGALRPLGEGEAPVPAGARVVAVAGIARPERFFHAVRAQGWTVVAELRYSDHHWYTPKDLAEINNVAQEARARAVVTTEKDAVRVGEQAWWAALPMQVAIEPEDEFRTWLRDRLAPSHVRRDGEASR